MSKSKKKFSRHKSKNKNRLNIKLAEILKKGLHSPKVIKLPCSLLQDLNDCKVSSISYDKYKVECNQCNLQNICGIIKIVSNNEFGKSPHASMPSLISLLTEKSKRNAYEYLNTKYIKHLNIELNHVPELSTGNEHFRYNKFARNYRKTFGKGAIPNGPHPKVNGNR